MNLKINYLNYFVLVGSMFFNSFYFFCKWMFSVLFLGFFFEIFIFLF